MLARTDEITNSAEDTRIEMRERAWLWYKDEYERAKETAPFALIRIKGTNYPVSQGAMKTIDNCTRYPPLPTQLKKGIKKFSFFLKNSVMVRIVSGIIALGWGWQNWKKIQLRPTPDSQEQKEAIIAQQVQWLEWIERVGERINATQPLGDEVLFLLLFNNLFPYLPFSCYSYLRSA